VKYADAMEIFYHEEHKQISNVEVIMIDFCGSVFCSSIF